MDSIKLLGASLHTFCKAERDNTDLVMWKSDIETAYCNLWLSKEWQTKQTVTISDKHYVDHCSCFENCSLYKGFLSLSSLVAWIAEHVKEIPHLKACVDDNTSFGLAGDVLYYKLYHHYFLTNQTKLPQLWNKLNIPHAKKKQIYRPVIPFVGLDIDSNRMVVSISDEHHSKSIVKVLAFPKPGKCHPLWEWVANGSFKLVIHHFPSSKTISFCCLSEDVLQPTLSHPHPCQ